MNEKLVQIMEMLTADGIKSSLSLDVWGQLDIYLWNDTIIDRHLGIRNVKYISGVDVDMVASMIEAYKKSQPARKA